MIKRMKASTWRATAQRSGVESNVFDTTADRLAERIRRDIVAGVFAPGERLRIATVANHYRTSHMPARDALRRLDAERIVEIQPHRGATLREVDATFVANQYDLRAALEALLVGRCIDRGTDAELAALPRLAATYEALATSRDRRKLLEANRELHSRIYSAARNPDAERIISQGWELLHYYRLRVGFGATRLQTVVREHRELVDAIMVRDRPRAIAAVIAHCNSARDDMLDCLELAASKPTKRRASR